MKIAAMICISLAIAINSFAQAYEASIEYSKEKHHAFVIEFPYPPEAVENALQQRMDKLGHRGKEEKGMFNKDKGFKVYKGAYITDISDKNLDFLVKVERKSRKEKDESILYLVILKDGVDAKDQFDAYEVDRTKRFLNDLEPHVEAANLERLILDQEQTIAKAEKKLRSLQDDKKALESRVKRLQDEIKTNEKSQQDAEKDIVNQKTALEGLKGRRKGEGH